MWPPASITPRQAAIVAAELAARYTAGSADFDSAANALDVAYLRLAPLGSRTTTRRTNAARSPRPDMTDVNDPALAWRHFLDQDNASLH